MSEPNSPKRIAAVLAITFYIMAAIAVASYVAMEVLQLPASQTDFAIGGILLLLLAPMVLILHHNDESRPVGFAARDKAIEARIAGLRSRPGAEPFFKLLRTGYPVTDEELTALIERVGALEAVPHRAKYVSWIYNAREITDEQIDYREIADRFALCEHFRPLEIAAKQAGLLSLVGPSRVEGAFILNPELAYSKFELPAVIECVYFPVTHPREMDDHHQLTCTICQSVLVSSSYGPQWPKDDARSPAESARP
jgi:hypothetical protein